jgi:hypothetical protein
VSKKTTTMSSSPVSPCFFSCSCVDPRHNAWFKYCVTSRRTCDHKHTRTEFLVLVVCVGYVHSYTRKQDTARHDTTRHDKTRQDKTRQGKTRHDKTRQDKARQDTTRQGKARHDKNRQDTTRQGKARRDKTRHDKTRQDKTKDQIRPLCFVLTLAHEGKRCSRV